MQRFIVYLLFLPLFFLLACVKDKPIDGEGNSEETVGTSAKVEQTGSYAQPVLPDRNNPKTQLLLRTYWVAEFWVNHADNSQNKPNKGRWWRFKEDGTFTTGQWEEELSYGSWVVYNDAEKELLHMDAANDALDMEFHMQATSQLKDYMSWAGTGTYDQKRIAVKATSLLSMPTKQQFGVQ